MQICPSLGAVGAADHRWLLQEPHWAQMARASYCMQLRGLSEEVASRLTPLLATEHRFFSEGRGQGAPHLMAAIWIIETAPLWSLCPHCVWDDTPLPVKSINSYFLHYKEQIPKLAIILHLPPDALHHCTNHCRDVGSGIRPRAHTWTLLTPGSLGSHLALFLSVPPLKVIAGTSEMLQVKRLALPGTGRPASQSAQPRSL